MSVIYGATYCDQRGRRNPNLHSNAFIFKTKIKLETQDFFVKFRGHSVKPHLPQKAPDLFVRNRHSAQKGADS